MSRRWSHSRIDSPGTRVEPVRVTQKDQIPFGEALRQISEMMTPGRRRQFLVVLGLMVLGALAELALIGSLVPFLSVLSGTANAPSWMLNVLDWFDSAGGEQRVATAALLFVATVLIATAIRLQLAWSGQAFTLGLGHDLSVDVQRRIFLQPYEYHVQHHTSEIIASLEKVHTLASAILFQLMQTAAAAVIGTAAIALLIAIAPLTAILTLVCLALTYWAVSKLSAKRLSINSEVLGMAYGERVKVIQEGLGGIRDLIIDRSQSLYVDQFRIIDERFMRAQAITAFIAGAPRFIIEGAALVLIAGLAVLLSARGSGFSGALPLLGALALGGLRILPLVQQAYRGWAVIAGNRAIVAQVLGLLQLPVPDPSQLDVPPLPFRHAIEVKGVSFRYPGRHSRAVEGVSLKIDLGERVALVGKTGSGKSTLADLIMGLLVPQEGHIVIDGVELNSAVSRAWTRDIAHVPQSIFLADASIARNIAFTVPEEEIDRERIAHAVGVAVLGEFVETLPDGLDTLIGERGVRLSGGQRQRLGIARAVYKRAPLLILDEATNALDHDTEEAVLANLMTETDRTILIIAHRESTVAGCGRVIRLDEGRLV